MFICYRKLHQRIIFKCVRYRTSRAAIRTFNDGSIQQPGIFIQQAHSTRSVKGKSCSASKKRVVSGLYAMSTITTTTTTTTTTKRKKVNTPRASNKENTCPFISTFFAINLMTNGTSSPKLKVLIISRLVYILDIL